MMQPTLLRDRETSRRAMDMCDYSALACLAKRIISRERELILVW
jgi:hypothetical protein